MNDNDPQDPPESPHVPLPDFTPVPRKCERHDGWTPERQKLFIEALADYGNVRAACDSVGLTTVGAYRLRRQPGAEEFAAAWEAALACGVKVLEDALMDRALNGVEVPVVSFGKLVCTRKVYDNRLGMFILRNRAPHRFAVGGGARALNAVGKMDLERHRKRWRAEWEAEQLRERSEKDKETYASIDAFLENMRNNRLAHMSPVQRERQIAADAQAKADAAAGWRPGGAYREYADAAAGLLPGFIAEVEAGWPPLPSWAWDEPEPGEEAEAPELLALPPPPEGKGEEPEEPAGPRVRSLKDEGW